MVDLITRLVGGLAALSQARTRPIDFVMLGDSNQLMDGIGFDHGLGKALSSRFGMYATPLYSQVVTGTGYSNSGHATLSVSLAAGAATGAPSVFDDHRLPMREYLYQDAVAIGTSNGVTTLAAADGIDVDANLRMHMAYGVFASGGGSFVPTIRRETSPFTVLQTGSAVSCAGASDAVGYSTLDLAAGVRGYDLGFKWQRNTASVPKTLQLWMRVENIDRAAGVSCHTMYGEGGQSLWDFATAILGHTDARLQNYFRSDTRLQRLRGLAPMVVVYINSGFNDRNETNTPSLGPLATGGPTSPLAYIDNLEAIRTKLDAAWVACGYSLDNLSYLLIPSHPISTPDDAQIITYRRGVERYVAGQRRMATIDLSTLTNYDTMLNSGWYRTGASEVIHLSQAGYEALGSLIAGEAP